MANPSSPDLSNGVSHENEENHSEQVIRISDTRSHEAPIAPSKSVDGIQGDARMALYINRLMNSVAPLKKVLDSAVIEENRTIEKTEAVKFLVLSAIADGIDLNSLVVTEEYTDAKGNLLGLEAKSTDPKTGNYKTLTYQIKRDQDVGETAVTVCSWNNGGEYPRSAEIFAEYKGNQWFLLDNSQPKGHQYVAQK